MRLAQIGIMNSQGGEALPPDYASLSNLELYVDYTGLVVGTTNDYGVVDGAGNVTTLKSVSPSPLTRDFSNVGTAPTLTADGIVFGGSGTLRAGVASKTWANFLHYAASVSNIKSVVHAVVKFGTTSDPNNAYGLFGNNASASANKGLSVFYDDRVSIPRNNGIASFMSNGNWQMINAYQDNIVTPNQFCVIRVETKWHTSAFMRQRIFVNEQLFWTNITSNGSNVVTTPTYDLEIGGVGNGVLPAVLTLKELLIQSSVDDQETYATFTQALLNKYNITAPSVLSTVSTNNTLTIYDTYQEAVGKYYLSAGLDQHPTKKYLVLGAFLDGVDHLADAGKKLSLRRSFDYGLTWEARTDIYDPAGDTCAQDLSSGFSANGRHHVFTDTHVVVGASFTPPHKIIYLYSDDEGVTYTTVDISSIIPVDDLLSFRTYGDVIENTSVLMTCGYRVTDEGSSANSERFILRSTDGGANWTYLQVERSAGYINEGSLIALDGTTIILICRNEVTKEWTQYKSSDNGLTWVNQGDLSFGETIGNPGPVRLTKFKIDATDVIACYYLDRDLELVKVIYGTADGIKTNGLAGWIIGTKTTVLSGTSRIAHYGDYLHPMGNFNAIMLSAYEKEVTDFSNNDLITALVPSTQYATVKTALGL